MFAQHCTAEQAQSRQVQTMTDWLFWICTGAKSIPLCLYWKAGAAYHLAMRLEGTAAMIALEREASVRVEPGARIEIVCLSGVLWVTQEGDCRDLFLAPGESLELFPRGATLVTALEPSTLRAVDRGTRGGLWRRWWGNAKRATTTVVIRPGAALLDYQHAIRPDHITV
jgi:Protein of unknown function (DUF2917)